MINPISCSPVVSARIVVFPSTQFFRGLCAFLASYPLLNFTRAMPWGKLRRMLMSGPCCLHRVCKVDPLIWVVRFFNSSQLLAGPCCPGAVVVVLDAPPFVPLLQPLQLGNPLDLGHPELAEFCCFETANVRDCPHKSWPIAVRLVALKLVGS